VILNSAVSLNSQITNLIPLCDKEEHGILLEKLHIQHRTQEETTVTRRIFCDYFYFLYSFLPPRQHFFHSFITLLLSFSPLFLFTKLPITSLALFLCYLILSKFCLQQFLLSVFKIYISVTARDQISNNKATGISQSINLNAVHPDVLFNSQGIRIQSNTSFLFLKYTYI